MTFRSLCLVALLSVLALVSGQQCDPVSSYTSLKTCLRQGAYDRNIRDAAVDSLKKMIPSYAFNDISKDSSNLPNAFPMKVDLIGSLDALPATFSVDVDLHEAIAAIFVPLHDAHTRYNKPSPYKYASFVQPFFLQHRQLVEGKEDEIGVYMYANDAAAVAYEQAYGAGSLPAFSSGSRVLKIDGQDVLTVLVQFSRNDIGYTKDAGARFNLAVHGYGDGKGFWNNRAQSSFPIPGAESNTYTLQNPDGSTVDVVFKWVGMYKPPQFMAQPSVKPVTELDEMRALFAEHDRALLASASSASDALGSEADGVSFRELSKTLGVLRVTTFNPKNQTSFIASIQEAIVGHQANGGSQLLLDFRANGGGDICLGYAFLRFLFPAITKEKDMNEFLGHYDMAASELFSHLSRLGANKMINEPSSQTVCGVDPEVVGYFTPCAWYDVDNKGFAGNDQWMLDGPTYTRGHSEAKYSRPIHEGCSAPFTQWLSPSVHSGYQPENVVLVSDGLCGSTCSVVSSFIQLHGLGKTIVLGGLPMEPMQFWAFPGGEVEQIEYIREVATKYGALDFPGLPALLPLDATFRFAIREIYPWNDNSYTVPTEFLFVPAHFHQPYAANFSDDDATYARAKAVFGKCVAGINDDSYPCSIEHGNGTRACVNGVRSTATCNLKNCDAGYYQEGARCMPCPAGYFRSADSALLGVCTKCDNAPASVPTKKDVDATCKVTYTGTAMASAQCPFVVDCVAAKSTDVKKVALISTGVGVLTFVVGLVLARFIMRRQDSSVNAGSDYQRV